MKVNCNLIGDSGISPIMCKGDLHLTNEPSELLVDGVFETIPGIWTFDREEGISGNGTSTAFTYHGSAARLLFQCTFGFITDTLETLFTFAIFKNGIRQARSESQRLIFFDALEEDNADITATVTVVSGDVIDIQVKGEPAIAGNPTITLNSGSITVLGGV